MTGKNEYFSLTISVPESSETLYYEETEDMESLVNAASKYSEDEDIRSKVRNEFNTSRIEITIVRVDPDNTEHVVLFWVEFL